MITRKQYPNHHVFETSIGGRPFTVETGKVAELADAECICRYGDTVVLTTVTCSPDPKPGIDYFPLTIEFEERMYAVGRIPGSFNRREGKPSERGILNSRIIDRPMRPLFDDELRNDVVVTCTVLANDYENPVEIVASLGASISVACSDVPWNGPIATTNVAYVGGQYVINPSAEQRSASECFVCIASTFEKVVMIETEAKEAPESIVLECIRIAHETNMEVVKFINTIVDDHRQAEVHVREGSRQPRPARRSVRLRHEPDRICPRHRRQERPRGAPDRGPSRFRREVRRKV